MTPDNIWILGITQEPSTKGYYLVFYHDTYGSFIQINKNVECMEYGDFYEIKEIGCGGYGTIYTAKYELVDEPETVVLKRFKHFDQMPELFINEVSYY